MEIIELHSLSASQVTDLIALMKELSPQRTVTSEMLENTVGADGSHLFAIMDADHIISCATLCVFDSPTGRKASVEDVVVLSAYRGRHLGRALMEHVIDFARRELGNVDLHLTSHPSRVAANALYRSLGFVQRETNVYMMEIREEGE